MLCRAWSFTKSGEEKLLNIPIIKMGIFLNSKSVQICCVDNRELREVDIPKRGE
jgi:hypothetical protein